MAANTVVQVEVGSGWVVHALVFVWADGTRTGTVLENDGSRVELTRRSRLGQSFLITPGDHIVRVTGYECRAGYLAHTIHLHTRMGRTISIAGENAQWRGAPFSYDSHSGHQITGCRFDVPGRCTGIDEVPLVQSRLAEARDDARTPLCVAAREGQLDVCKALVRAGAGVEQADLSGNRPLHWAAWAGRWCVVQFLLRSGASPNQGNDNGETPLHLAAEGGHREAAEFLMAGGASLQAQDRWGRTPAQRVAQRGHEALARFLEATADPVRLAEEASASEAAAHAAAEAEPGAPTCAVCLVGKIGVCMVPCGHLCVCRACSQNVGGRCPICKADAQAVNIAPLHERVGGSACVSCQAAAAPLATGTKVVLQGLVQAAEHNGRIGTVQSLDVGTQRYKVLLDGGRVLAVKRSNLQQHGVAAEAMPVNICLVHCGHIMCLCRPCSQSLGGRCRVCHAAVTQVVRTYESYATA